MLSSSLHSRDRGPRRHRAAAARCSRQQLAAGHRVAGLPRLGQVGARTPGRRRDRRPPGRTVPATAAIAELEVLPRWSPGRHRVRDVSQVDAGTPPPGPPPRSSGARSSPSPARSGHRAAVLVALHRPIRTTLTTRSPGANSSPPPAAHELAARRRCHAAMRTCARCHVDQGPPRLTAPPRGSTARRRRHAAPGARTLPNTTAGAAELGHQVAVPRRPARAARRRPLPHYRSCRRAAELEVLGLVGELRSRGPRPGRARAASGRGGDRAGAGRRARGPRPGRGPSPWSNRRRAQLGRGGNRVALVAELEVALVAKLELDSYAA
jgi:hypothetical protein